MKLSELSTQDLLTSSLLESTLKNAPLGFALFNQQHEYLHVNEALAKINGIPAEDHIGKTMADILPGNLKVLGEILNKVFATKKPILNFEVRGEVASTPGVERAWLTTFYPVILDRADEIEYVGVAVMEITDRVRAEEALREQEMEIQRELKQREDRLRQISDFMPQIVWSTDARGYHDFFNKRWYEFTGLSYDDTKGEKWIKVLHPDDLDRTRDVWNRSLKTGNLYQIEYRMKRYDGEYRWLLARAIPLRQGDGSIERWYGTCTDIHDQKTMSSRMEELVQERTKELRRSNEDLQQFAHVASHDLQEPVRKIQVFESIINHEFGQALPAQVNVYLSKIKHAAYRIASMISGVLLYSSIEGSLLKHERIDLASLIRDIETDLDLPIAEKKAKLEYYDLPVIKGTPTLIYQLFYNLLNNSLKFSDPARPLRIRIRARPVHVNRKPFHEIVIQDTGIGFDNAYAETIFGTFTRLHSKDKFEGTGLGLALCKKIVERHGGSIRANGADGVGAEFIILLPVEKEWVSSSEA